MIDLNNVSNAKKQLKTLIDTDVKSKLKQSMDQGVNYYKSRHDILDYKLYYVDSNNVVTEEKNRSNTKISHSFFTELVDQKTQYLLSNGIEVKTEQEGLSYYLKEYIDSSFQNVLRQLVKGASQKAIEYVFWNKNKDNKIEFKKADARNVIPQYNELGELTQVIYYYTDVVFDKNKQIKVTKAQIWTSEHIYYFIQENTQYILDKNVEINPRPHQIAVTKDNEIYSKSYNRVPFITLKNNDEGINDLTAIKELIDDYDLMACALSNNLIDFDTPIYAVKGYRGDTLDNLITNIKTKKTLGLSENGSIEVKTVDIPIEARKSKLEIDKQGIYKFGMGFDSSQSGDGNITNVVIMSRYTLLDLKCDKIEGNLRIVIDDMLSLIIDNINERYGKNYKKDELEVVIERDIMLNESDIATVKKTDAERKLIEVNTILQVAPRLDDETVLEQIAIVLGLDIEELKKRLEEQDYTSLSLFRGANKELSDLQRIDNIVQSPKDNSQSPKDNVQSQNDNVKNNVQG